MSTPMPEKTAPLEMASVLFMDIVGYSLEPMERQSALLQQLQSVVRSTPQFQDAQSRNQLISLPTGDGMALVFFANPTVPVECALNVCRALKQYPDIRLRMGVHTGPVYRIADINANMNVAGGGINMAQRVMDSGDSGHLLVSASVAEVLRHLSGWPESLKDLGEHPVKHGVRMHLYALCTNDVPNQEVPMKLRPKSSNSSGSRRRILIAAAGGGLVLACAAGLLAWRSTRGTDGQIRSPALPERALSYWITVQKYKDDKPWQQPFRLASDINFEANYRIQLGFRSTQDGYLYLINEGPVPRNGLPDYHILFPSPTANGESAHVDANTDVLFPPAGRKPIRFDDQAGTEKLWVVWTRDDLPELTAAKSAASFRPEDGGSIRDPRAVVTLREFLQKHVAEKPESREDEVRKVTTVRANGDVLVHLRKLEHN